MDRIDFSGLTSMSLSSVSCRMAAIGFWRFALFEVMCREKE